MPPPARHRDHYVIGRCGSYLAATCDLVDKHLRDLRVQLRTATDPRRAANLRHDLDQLLDRRAQLETP